MPTCIKCGHSKSGQWFKNKKCPVCNESQETDKIKESTITNNVQNVVIEEKEEKDDLEELFNTSQDSDLYGEDIPTISEETEEKPKTQKTTLDAEMWETLTTELYRTANELLKPLNPEFYESKQAESLVKTNAKMSAVILADKEVNPLVLLAFSNILYILPAIKGLFKKDKKEESEESEVEE